jgi:hypothetical protein
MKVRNKTQEPHNLQVGSEVIRFGPGDVQDIPDEIGIGHISWLAADDGDGARRTRRGRDDSDE